MAPILDSTRANDRPVGLPSYFVQSYTQAIHHGPEPVLPTSPYGIRILSFAVIRRHHAFSQPPEYLATPIPNVIAGLEIPLRPSLPPTAQSFDLGPCICSPGAGG